MIGAKLTARLAISAATSRAPNSTRRRTHTGRRVASREVGCEFQLACRVVAKFKFRATLEIQDSRKPGAPYRRRQTMPRRRICSGNSLFFGEERISATLLFIVKHGARLPGNVKHSKRQRASCSLPSRPASPSPTWVVDLEARLIFALTTALLERRVYWRIRDRPSRARKRPNHARTTDTRAANSEDRLIWTSQRDAARRNSPHSDSPPPSFPPHPSSPRNEPPVASADFVAVRSRAAGRSACVCTQKRSKHERELVLQIRKCERLLRGKYGGN